MGCGASQPTPEPAVADENVPSAASSSSGLGSDADELTLLQLARLKQNKNVPGELQMIEIYDVTSCAQVTEAVTVFTNTSQS